MKREPTNMEDMWAMVVCFFTVRFLSTPSDAFNFQVETLCTYAYEHFVLW